MFVWSEIYLLFALVARGFFGSLAEVQNGDRSACPLIDPPNQCGEFCLTVLKPLIDHIAMHQQQWNNNSDVLRLNESLEKLDSQHTAQMSVLQEVLTTIKNSKMPPNKVIPPGFEKIGKRYFYVEGNHHQNWFSASKTCVQMGGQLAVIQDEQELRNLRERITHDTSYWLDINDLVNEGHYVSWTTGKRAPFLTWQSGEPNNAYDREHCVDLYKGVFYDDKCETRYYFICQASED